MANLWYNWLMIHDCAWPVLVRPEILYERVVTTGLLSNPPPPPSTKCFCCHGYEQNVQVIVKGLQIFRVLLLLPPVSGTIKLFTLCKLELELERLNFLFFLSVPCFSLHILCAIIGFFLIFLFWVVVIGSYFPNADL